jgi:hypothetical protein
MESVTMNLQARLEQVFVQKARPKSDLRLERMPLRELLYFALVESADKSLIAQA